MYTITHNHHHRSIISPISLISSSSSSSSSSTSTSTVNILRNVSNNVINLSLILTMILILSAAVLIKGEIPRFPRLHTVQSEIWVRNGRPVGGLLSGVGGDAERRGSRHVLQGSG